jgi:hypothetical protein
LGYPPSLLDLEFDHSFMMRGLIVDKKRGNVIKVGWAGPLGWVGDWVVVGGGLGW